MNAGEVDLEQARPELPGYQQTIPDRIECDAVRDSAASGDDLTLRSAQQIPYIDPTHNTPRFRVDASNEICLILVRPQLTPNPLQLI